MLDRGLCGIGLGARNPTLSHPFWLWPARRVRRDNGWRQRLRFCPSGRPCLRGLLQESGFELDRLAKGSRDLRHFADVALRLWRQRVLGIPRSANQRFIEREPLSVVPNAPTRIEWRVDERVRGGLGVLLL